MNAEELRTFVLTRLQEQGFEFSESNAPVFSGEEKEQIRKVQLAVARQHLLSHRPWIQQNLSSYLPFFANGNEVIPEKIYPSLVEVTTPSQHNLFRLARLLWSLPYSIGVGRRMRFLVFDRSNGKLIGLFAFQSPPLDFSVRDKLFQYPPGEKIEKINQTMDIYVLGAVPPYNFLLGGKLVALLTASNEVRQKYREKYHNRITLMEQRQLSSHLVALTTLSAFGRSSLYNRLKYKGEYIAEPIGYARGYGIFHLLEFYPLFCEFLEKQGISIRSGYGSGPRPKWQTIAHALRLLNFSPELLHHGIKREVFLFRLIHNLEDYMSGNSQDPVYRDLPMSSLIAWWRERWLLPRSQRVQTWREWNTYPSPRDS